MNKAKHFANWHNAQLIRAANPYKLDPRMGAHGIPVDTYMKRTTRGTIRPRELVR